MSNREPIFHDRQFVIDQVSQNTSSLIFVDITNAEITTKDLAVESNYSVFFTLIISGSVANTIASFQILANGGPISMMPRTVNLKTNNADLGATFMGAVEDINGDDVLQVQWKTDKGTLTLSEFNFFIDGIPEHRVI